MKAADDKYLSVHEEQLKQHSFNVDYKLSWVLSIFKSIQVANIFKGFVSGAYQVADCEGDQDSIYKSYFTLKCGRKLLLQSFDSTCSNNDQSETNRQINSNREPLELYLYLEVF